MISPNLGRTSQYLRFARPPTPQYNNVMSIILCSDFDVLVAQAAAQDWRAYRDGFVVLLTDGASDLAAPLEETMAAADRELLVVDVNGPRFSRLNFDAMDLVILDLPPQMLLSSGGRRLVDALGHLAVDELGLAFVGPAIATIGGFLEDGVTAGLNLIPNAAVVPAVQQVADLHTLLARLSERQVRLLALDGSVCIRYDFAADMVTVLVGDRGETDGSALMVAFVAATPGDPPVARLHVLTSGMTRSWPDK